MHSIFSIRAINNTLRYENGDRMRNLEKTSTEIIKEFDNEIQTLFRIKQRCDLKGLRDTISELNL